MAYKPGTFSKSVVSNETNLIAERLESIEMRLNDLENSLQTFNNTFSSIQRKERASWKNFSNEELRLYHQTQSSMMNSVKILCGAVKKENNTAISTIQEHGIIISNKVAIILLILFYISFGGWMLCMVKLLK